MRAIKLEENYLTYVSFIAPRKSTQFQEDLYPDCAGLTAALVVCRVMLERASVVWWGDQEAQAGVAEARRATARWIIIAEGISAICPASAAAEASAAKQSAIIGTVSLKCGTGRILSY